MRTLLSTLLIVVLGLWLGGLVALVIFVSSLFLHDRVLASDAAPWLFHVFERYQLGLAGVAIVLAVLWRVMGSAWQRSVVFVATILAGVLATFEIGYVTPNVVSSRTTEPVLFEHYHHMATTTYSATTIVVLIALVMTVISLWKSKNKSL